MIAETDLAYIAGIMDGEGCIRIKKSPAYKCQDRATPGYNVMVQIKMVDEPAIAFVAQTLGGWYYQQKPNATKGRPLYCWQASDKAAELILTQLLPYLRVKSSQAQLCLALRALRADSMKHRTKIVGYRDFPNKYGTNRRVPNYALSDEFVAQCEAMYQRSKVLNKVGV